MTPLTIGASYLCSDNEYRRLTKIEEGYLHYDVAIARNADGSLVWTSVSRTYRGQVELKFTDGQIIG